MSHTKFKGYRRCGSREEDFIKFYHIRAFWSCDLDRLNKLSSLIPWRLHMKFVFDWPSGFWEEDVWRVWTTDACLYYNPLMSLWLRWAKNERKRLFNSPKLMTEILSLNWNNSQLTWNNILCLHSNFLDKQYTIGSLSKIHVSFKSFLFSYIWYKCQP